MCWGRVTMLVLCFVVLCIVRSAARASSVEVFFVDAELVGDEFDGPRREEPSCVRGRFGLWSWFPLGRP